MTYITIQIETKYNIRTIIRNANDIDWGYIMQKIMNPEDKFIIRNLTV